MKSIQSYSAQSKTVNDVGVKDNSVTRIRTLIKNIDAELVRLCEPVSGLKNNVQTIKQVKVSSRKCLRRTFRRTRAEVKQITYNKITNAFRATPLKSPTPHASSGMTNAHLNALKSYHLGCISQPYQSNLGLGQCLLPSPSKSSTSCLVRKLASASSLKWRHCQRNVLGVSNYSKNICKMSNKMPANYKVKTTAITNNNNNNDNDNKDNKDNVKQQEQGQRKLDQLKLKSNYTKTTVPGVSTHITSSRRYTLVKRPVNLYKLNRYRLHGGSQSRDSLIIRPMNHFGMDIVSPTVVTTRSLSTAYRTRVLDAFRNRRIFMVMGNYGTIRRALLKRGWLEKLTTNRYPRLQGLNEEALLQQAKRGNEYEAVAISKIINHFPAFFVWQPRGHRDIYDDVQPYRNRIRRANALDFATKVGLIGCAEQQQWYRQEGVSGMLYPRFFRLGGANQEQTAFIEEFRMTQCYSVLRFICRHSDLDKSVMIIDMESGIVPATVLHFALERVKKQVENWENANNIDGEPVQIPANDWEQFLANSSTLLNKHAKLKCTYRELMENMNKSKVLLEKLEEMRPDFKFDGYRNLWILKPGYQCRGLNIIIRNNLDEILNFAKTHSSRRYIVQKYIEQPLLIYNTKFDIRQYMLLYIRESTIQIWLYRDCYLRFSSQEYSLDDLREIIHLTNNSVQKKYKNKATRDPRLPKCNMWPLSQFRAYLIKQGVVDNVWDNRVYPGFKQNLIAVVLASLDETNFCENCFELYGCDFMLDEMYNPILIEINASPDLSPSTEVTARICPVALQDLIKVVVDIPNNKNSSTGLFQLVHEINYKFKTDPGIQDTLNIHGKAITLSAKDRFKNNFIRKLKKDDNNGKRQSQQQQKHPEQQRHQENQQQKAVRNVQKATRSAKSISKQISSTMKTASKVLKPAIKEALAIHYTMPK